MELVNYPHRQALLTAGTASNKLLVTTGLSDGRREDSMSSLKSFFNNMRAPMPWPKKIALAFRNNFIKLRKRQDCCGHYGEPGC